jgi:hypothetical protein
VSGFSEDGQWWWDGATWIPTAQLVLPQLPPTEFEQSGKLKFARDLRTRGKRRFWALVLPLGLLGLTPAQNLGARDYRSWTLDQLALATAYLLPPDEPMLAGEVSMYDVLDTWTRDLAVAVTAAHVLVFRIDWVDGQPRSIALVARPSDVKIESPSGMFGYLWPALVVSGWNGRWTIHGYRGAFEPESVLHAWRKAANGA